MRAVRTSMIVQIGIIATNTVKGVLFWLFIAVGVLVTGVGLYRLVKGIREDSSRDRLTKNSLAYRAKSSGPKEIRDQLMTLKGLRPKLSELIDKCLGQLDVIAGQLARFDQLVASNDAQGVSGARVGLEEIERTLISNFKSVINIGIAASAGESSETDARCTEMIERAVAANAKALEKGNQFLLEIADNISKFVSDTTMLDAWLKTIRDQNKLSLIETGDKPS
jgi:hypothetical protein